MQHTNVREATEEDKLDVILLAKQFLKESKYPFSLDVETLDSNFSNAIDHPNFLILVLEVDKEIVGMLVGATAAPLFSKDLIATELAWFVEKPYRTSRPALKLFKKYEEWAKESGCKFITMVDIDTLADLGDLYTRKGYTMTEKTYVKEI